MEDNNKDKEGDLGGLHLPSTGVPTGDSASSNSLSASASVIQRRKTRSDAGQSRGARGTATTTSVPAISQQQFTALYDPKLWARVTSAPADTMAAITGDKTWEIKQEERDMLGGTCSVAAQCFAVSDPRWLAASLAFVAILDVYGTRAAFYIADRNRKRKEEEKAKEKK